MSDAFDFYYIFYYREKNYKNAKLFPRKMFQAYLVYVMLQILQKGKSCPDISTL